jgi:CheY-like chemotaxis protein
MGGMISVESEPDRGSRFLLTVGFEKQKESEIRTPEVSVDIEGTRNALKRKEMRNILILLAEDNPINQKIAEVMLIKAGFNVDVAANGRIAVEAADKRNYDIVLMDVQMPEMDGLAATRMIREHEKGDKHNIIIAMTAHALKGDRERFMEAGMDDYISKPIDPPELINLIEKWIRPKLSNYTESENSRVYAEIAETKETAKGLPIDFESAIIRFDNDKDFLKKMVIEFLGYVPDEIKALEEAVNSGDAGTIQKYGHSIKGAARMLSADMIAGLALRIENKGYTDDLADVPSLLRTLKEEIARLEDYARTITEQA